MEGKVFPENWVCPLVGVTTKPRIRRRDLLHAASKENRGHLLQNSVSPTAKLESFKLRVHVFS